MEEDSPRSPHNSKQAPKEPLTSQQDRKSAPIAHRKGQETRNEDVRTAPPADHQMQDSQQNRRHNEPHIASTTELNDTINTATPKYYSTDNHINNLCENSSATYNTTTTIQPQYYSIDSPMDTPYKEDFD